MKSLVIIALLVAASPTWADVPASCVETVCGPASHHPGDTYPCDESCRCMDDCSGDSSGGGGGGGLGGALVKGTVKLIGYSALGIAFLFMPGHMAEATSTNGPKQTAEQAHADWDKFVAHRAAVIEAGKQAEQSRTALLKLDAEERAELRDAPANKKPALKPFNPPKLKPDLGFQCRGAVMRITPFHPEGSVGSFPSEAVMVAQCKQFAPAPKPPDQLCTQGTSRPCGLDPEVCCPNDSPIFNACDGQCYAEWNFVNSPTDAGLHCAARECGALFKP